MARSLVDFIHNDFRFKEDDEVEDDHPMVGLRPDLFTDVKEPDAVILPAPNPTTKARPRVTKET
jgi:hypothetical protein